MLKTGKLHIWVPELVAHEGGIQSYSNEIVEAALQALGPDRVTVISKLDQPEALKARFSGKIKMYATGHVPTFLRTPVFAWRVLVKALLDRPQLVLSTHAHFSPVASWLQSLFGIPSAVSAHGVEVWDLPNGRVRDALQSVRKILPVSGYTRRRMEKEMNLPASRFMVIPDTFDPVRFSPGPAPVALRQRYRVDPQDTVLLSVSRLVVSEQYKGYRKILEVLPRLMKTFPKLKFVLVGRGDDGPNVERMIRELGLEGKVVLTGYVPENELADHYRMADFFAMPSKREGFGIVFLEAMGCGKRCLGGNKDAAVDALRQGELGILVDPDDPNDVEQGLRRLLAEPAPDPKELHQLADQYFGRAAFREKVRALLDSVGLK